MLWVWRYSMNLPLLDAELKVTLEIIVIMITDQIIASWSQSWVQTSDLVFVLEQRILPLLFVKLLPSGLGIFCSYSLPEGERTCSTGLIRCLMDPCWVTQGIWVGPEALWFVAQKKFAVITLDRITPICILPYKSQKDSKRQSGRRHI